ncbi:MAG: head-tail adaptor protein [Rickettsiaceae bacterium]|nr:head-tail adaptor protein [Rickettsiaceae bacterium]
MSKLPLFGILKHKISILENASPDELSENWQEIEITFAQIKPLYDNKVESLDSFAFGNIVTDGYFVFQTRGSIKVSTKMRIKFKNRIFDIKRVIDVEEAGRWLKIIALEIERQE